MTTVPNFYRVHSTHWRVSILIRGMVLWDGGTPTVKHAASYLHFNPVPLKGCQMLGAMYI